MAVYKDGDKWRVIYRYTNYKGERKQTQKRGFATKRKYYVIGENHKVFIANKNEDDDYYILTLAAIAKELAFRNISTADVLLAVGLPLNWLSNQRQGFKDYLMRNSEVDFTLRDMPVLLLRCHYIKEYICLLISAMAR